MHCAVDLLLKQLRGSREKIWDFTIRYIKNYLFAFHLPQLNFIFAISALCPLLSLYAKCRKL